jgi:glycosyltransferase involved in cell wall biosynthesis
MRRLPRPAQILGILPGLRGSLSDADRQGQISRYVDSYLGAYLQRFDRVRFFSYEPERIEQFTDDRELRRRIEVIAPPEPRGRTHALWLGTAGRSLFRDCTLLRVLQAPGAVPAVLARAVYVCTYGYDYLGFTAVSGPAWARTPLITIKRRAMELGIRRIVRGSTATIVTSEDGRDAAMRLGATRVSLIRNGVDLETFAPRDGEPLCDVLFVGQLVARKGVDTLIRAAATLPGRPTVVLIGDGPERESLERLARMLGVDAEFRGRLDNAEVAALLARARCFVLPSLAEGQPKALLEAIASGVAAIASDIRGHREVAAFGGIRLFRAADAGELAAALADLLGDEEKRRQLGEAGRRAAQERFDLGALLEAELDLLCEVARPHPWRTAHRS